MTNILIIDDVALMCKVIQNIVGDYGNCEIATSGQSAIDIFRSRHEKNETFNVVFLDINMPETDGYKVLKSIREYENDKNIDPKTLVIMLSAISDTYNKDKAFEMGANDFIAKPMNKNAILSSLESHGVKKP